MSIYDKASLVQIPSAFRNSKLYSPIPESGNGDFNHVRSSVATRINKQGLIEEVTFNVPRLDYPVIDGIVQNCPNLLLEPERINLISDSQEFDGYYKNSVSVEDNYDISPDGNINASLITATNTFAAFFSNYDINAIPNELYTISLFVRKTNNSPTDLSIAEDWSSTFLVFDLDEGEIVSNPYGVPTKVKKYKNNWYRVEYTITSADIGEPFTFIASRIFFPNGSAVGTNFQVFGHQIEKGSYASSYIKTVGSQVTRALDNCYGGSIDVGVELNEGTLFIDTKASDTDDKKLIVLTSGSGDRITFGVKPNGDLEFVVVFNNVQYVNYSTNIAGERKKVAISFKNNEVKIYVNSSLIFTDNTTQVRPLLNTLNFKGANPTFPYYYYGETKELTLFNESLSNSEMQNLTTL